MGRRTKDEAAKTRESIMEAAIDVFIEKGVSRTSLQDIAKACGVTRGAVYHHFENKFALLMELLESVRNPVDAIWDEMAAASEGDPLETLQSCIATTFGHMLRDEKGIRIHKLLFFRCEYNQDLEKLMDWESNRVAFILTNIEQLYTQAADKGLLKADVPPELAAYATFSLMVGLYQNFLKYGCKCDIEKSHRFAIESLLNGIRK